MIDEYLRKTMQDNFELFEKYPHYTFNFSGANRYRLMKEYFPADFEKVKKYVDEGRWFPAGSSMEEGDVNTPSAEAIIRQILCGKAWFRREFGKASAEYMLPDCFGFPSSSPTLLAHSGVKGFSTQKLVWGSSADGGDIQSREKTPEGTPFNASSLQVSKDSLENAYHRIWLNHDGDVASIFDKEKGRELLSAPARLAISYDNPAQWPEWNMDWEQEQSAPKAYVSGPAQVRVVDEGPVRVSLEVIRQTARSRFVQTINLSAGEGGKRVELGNAIDWNTRESNLKATFPLTANNVMATYNWDIGTIERPAEPKKFEVPSHQWIDLTDMSGEYGATVLTDSKNGSDKPNDNTLRLTLLRTPGVADGYTDQVTQEIGHHEFVYGFAGHSSDWRSSQTDWQVQRLNAPLLRLRHLETSLGLTFSLLRIDNPRIRVLALKKAELSDEVIVRLVELDGNPQSDVKVSFAAPIASAREVNGQEQPVGSATEGQTIKLPSGHNNRFYVLAASANGDRKLCSKLEARRPN